MNFSLHGHEIHQNYLDKLFQGLADMKFVPVSQLNDFHFAEIRFRRVF